MAESNPNSGALWMNNFVDDATINEVSSSTAEDLYSLSAQLSPLRSERTWFENGTPSEKAISFDMGSAVTPTCFAVIGSNIESGQALRLYGAETADMATNLVTWSMTTYAQADPHDVLKFYLGVQDSGSSPIARRYWQVRFNTAESYVKVGSIYIGTYTDIRPSPVSDTFRDPSKIAYASGGAPYVDRLPWYTQASFRVGVLDRGDYYALRAGIMSHGSRHLLIDVHANDSDAGVRPYSARWGLVAKGSPVSGSMKSVTNNSVSIKFTESRG